MLPYLRIILPLLTAVLASTANAKNVSEEFVLPDRAHILRYYWNCNGKLGKLNAKADRGFVRSEKSTRYVCGNPDHPVIQFVYISPEGYRGPDTVRYYLANRLNYVDRLTVGDRWTVGLVQQPDPVDVAGDQEKVVRQVWDCSRKTPDAHVTARHGFTSIRDGFDDVCGNSRHPVRQIVYRRASGFTGTDQVVIKSEFAPPMVVPVTVFENTQPAPTRPQAQAEPSAPTPASPLVGPSPSEDLPLPTLSADQRWIVIASRQDFEEAKQVAWILASHVRDVHVVRAKNGWYAVVAGPMERAAGIKTLAELKNEGSVPEDSKITRGETYTGLVWSGKNFLEAIASHSGKLPTVVTWQGLETKIDAVQDPDGEEKTPVAYGFVRGQPVFTIKLDGVALSEPTATLRLLWLDRTSPYPQVLFTSYWGGAHCCTVTAIASARNASDWQVKNVGAFDGDGLVIQDVGDTGTPVLVDRDNRFLYRYSSYAGSVAPLQYWRLEGGDLKDVTREDLFKPQLRRQLAMLEKDIDWSDPDFERNGYLAGWVALKALLGEESSAWNEMLKRYDRTSDNGLEECSVTMPAGELCPSDKILKRTFPESLGTFLVETGYLATLPPKQP